MSRRLWPFKPVSPILDSFNWLTDVFRSKAGEQRIGLRKQPARRFNFQLELTEIESNYARNLIRANLGGDEFYVPDWTQQSYIGSISSGSSISVAVDIDQRIYGDYAVVWQDAFNCEVVEIDIDSNGLIIDILANSYSAAYILPAWTGSSPSGLNTNDRGARRINASIEFVLDSIPEFGIGTYQTYRGYDVIPDCPFLAPGLSRDLFYQISTFGGDVGNAEYLRSRSLVEEQFNINWQKFGYSDAVDLKKWVATRYGRQKAFWASTSQQDLDPASSISGTTFQIFSGILTRTAVFDIEISDKQGNVYHRRVSSTSVGTPIDGKPVADIEIDSAASVDIDQISRISYLIFCRFDSDRAEFEHTAPYTTRLSMPCIEVPDIT
jgi:hypothetical protein